jgi:hypothetical protein
MNKLRDLISKHGAKKVSDLIGSRLVPDTRVLSYELRANVAKSGFFRPEYSFDVPLSSTTIDFQGQTMSESFLKAIPSRVKNLKGYYEDEHPEGFVRDSSPDFEMDNLRFENGRLVGTVHIVKNGPKASDIIRSMKDGRPRGVSIELKRALVSSDNVILDAENVNGFIITSNPANKDTLFTSRKVNKR